MILGDVGREIKEKSAPGTWRRSRPGRAAPGICELLESDRRNLRVPGALATSGKSPAFSRMALIIEINMVT
jgi:hypothetical protein